MNIVKPQNKVFTGIGVYGINHQKYLDLRGLDLPSRLVKRVTIRLQLEILLREAGIEDMESENFE